MQEDDDVTMAAIDNCQRRPDHAILRSLFPDDDIVEEEQMHSLSQLISTASTSSEPTTHILLHPASSASFVFVLTQEGRIHQSSTGVSGHLGFRQEEFVGQSVFNFVPVADQSLITRLLPVACHDASSSRPRRRERFRCAFLSRMRLDHQPREVQFEISALRCDSLLFDSQSGGCVVCVARRLPEEANKVIALSLLLDVDGIVHSVFTRNCSTHQGTFQQLVGGAFRAAVAPEYVPAAERLLATQCDAPLELDLLLADKQFRVAATSLSAPRGATRLECTVSWCTVRKTSPAFQPQLLQQQQTIVPPPSYAGYETSPPDPQDALSLVCSSVFGDENMNMPATQEIAPTEKVRKKPGPKKGPSKPRAKKGAAAAAAAATPQDSAVSSSTGDDKNSVLKSLLGAPIQHPMPMEMHPAYYNPVMYQQPQQSAAAVQQQQQQQQMYAAQQQAQQQPNGYMVDMQQAQQWQAAQQAHPQAQMYYQQQMAYQMPAAQPVAAPAPAPTNSKKRKASNENGEKKPRGRQSAAAQAEAARAAQAAQAAAALAAQQQQQQQVYYQQNQMMPADMAAAYRFDPMQQQQMQLAQQQQQHWMMQQQPGTMSMQQVPQQMQPAQLSMIQQQQSAAAAAQQQQVQQAQQQQRPQPTMQQPQQAGSEFVRMELRQSLQAKQQMAGRPSPSGNAMDVAVASVGSTGSTAGSGTFEYLSDLLSEAELETVFDFKLCSGGNGCGFDLENDDYTRKVVQRLLS